MAELSNTADGHAFINVSNNPDDGRDLRRTRVRRIVMSEHHRRRRRLQREGEQLPGQELQASSGGETGRLSSLVADPSQQAFARMGLHQPFLAMQVWSDSLFQSRQWSSTLYDRMSCTIKAFLVGQTPKAAKKLSHTFFIHKQYDNMDDHTLNTFTPLQTCKQLLCFSSLYKSCSGPSYSDLAFSHSAFWSIVQKEQDMIYTRVGNPLSHHLTPYSSGLFSTTAFGS